MKGYLVDTNVPSELTRETPDARVAAFLESAGKESVFLSVTTVGEVCKGIDMLPASQKRSALQAWPDIDERAWFAGRILPVTESIAERWGRLAAAAKRKGVTLAVVDGVLAATALEHHLTLVTRNVRDFADLGVAVLNPWDAVDGTEAPVT
ncbi:MAG TPA: type II toxin-antitoxin system VapC family toxin [Bryobacteraceae bacterium]|nr:type II toxin-antitoxin system VapC family toxin [Bryobacteraceae bacterium]